mgnify:CR=1 FL=1|jgi:hypothetical protein
MPCEGRRREAIRAGRFPGFQKDVKMLTDANIAKINEMLMAHSQHATTDQMMKIINVKDKTSFHTFIGCLRKLGVDIPFRAKGITKSDWIEFQAWRQLNRAPR